MRFDFPDRSRRPWDRSRRRSAACGGILEGWALARTGATIYGGANQGATRMMHSQDQDIANWKSKWTPILANTLAIYDGVDGTCGNQFGACGAYTHQRATAAALSRRRASPVSTRTLST